MDDPALLRALNAELAKPARGRRSAPDAPGPGLRLRQGVVQLVTPTSGTCTIRLGGGTTDIPNVRYLASTIPLTGQSVWVLQHGDGVDDYIVLGALSPAAVAGCRLRRAAVQTFTSGALASITWDTEDEDPHGYANVPDSTLSVPTGLAGYHIVTAAGVWSGPAGVFAAYRFVMGGITYETIHTGNGFPGYTIGPVLLTAGASISIQAIQSSGGSLDLTARLTVVRLPG